MRGRGAGNRTRTGEEAVPAARSTSADVAAFLRKAATPAPLAQTRGRLMFALDATMSRQPTWNSARRLQSEMFDEASRLGGLAVKLVYFRGYDECRATPWLAEPDRLAALMGKIECQGGHTQIVRVLQHAVDEARRQRLGALVYVGDAMEENLDELCAVAGELALLNCPVFAFQEGHDRAAEQGFREMARLTRGAWHRFDGSSPAQLRGLLRAAAAYATGGLPALEALTRGGDGDASRLLTQLR